MLRHTGVPLRFFDAVPLPQPNQGIDRHRGREVARSVTGGWHQGVAMRQSSAGYGFEVIRSVRLALLKKGCWKGRKRLQQRLLRPTALLGVLQNKFTALLGVLQNNFSI